MLTPAHVLNVLVKQQRVMFTRSPPGSWLSLFRALSFPPSLWNETETDCAPVLSVFALAPLSSFDGLVFCCVLEPSPTPSTVLCRLFCSVCLCLCVPRSTTNISCFIVIRFKIYNRVTIVRSTRTAATVKCRSSATRTRRCAIGCAMSFTRRCPTPRSSRSSTTRSGCTARRPLRLPCPM